MGADFKSLLSGHTSRIIGPSVNAQKQVPMRPSNSSRTPSFKATLAEAINSFTNNPTDGQILNKIEKGKA